MSDTSSSSSPAVFDPSTMVARAKEHVNAVFLSLVPPDQLESMVKGMVDGYFARVKVPYSDKYASPFETEVTRQLQERIQERVKKHIDELFRTEWDDKLNVTIAPRLKELMAELAPGIVSHLLTQTLSQAFQGMR